MKQLTLTVITVFAIALGLAFVAAPPGDAQGDIGSTGQYTTPAANAVNAQGGNVTAVNVSSNQTTSKWQGYWGNVSGALTLGDGSAVFYDWSTATFQAVYASPGNNIDWTTVSDLSGAAAREGKDTDYGFTSTDADSINRTMSGAGCSAGGVFTAADGVFSYNSTGGNSDWQTCLGEDGGTALDDTVFGTNIVQNGGDAYNGQLVQYQLMVPVIAANDDYYFYLEV